MTKKQLLSALVRVQFCDVNVCEMCDRFLDGEDVSDEYIADLSAKELYSDDLLKELNRRLAFVPATDMNVDEANVAKLAMSEEQDDCEIIPKVWPVKAVCVGLEELDGGQVGDMFYFQGMETYMDENGDLFVVDVFEYCVGESDTELEDMPSLTYRRLSMGSEPWSLSAIADLLPAKYKGFWDA